MRPDPTPSAADSGAVPASPIGLERARPLVAAHAVPLAPVAVALESALGRVLAEDLRAYADVPASDNAAMDGYAVRAADTEPGARLRVVAEARAGALALIPPGEGVVRAGHRVTVELIG